MSASPSGQNRTQPSDNPFQKVASWQNSRQNTSATHPGASCQICQLFEQKVLQCLQAVLHDFFYTHHRSIFMHILVHCGFASIRWVLMFCLAGVLLPLHTSNAGPNCCLLQFCLAVVQASFTKQTIVGENNA